MDDDALAYAQGQIDETRWSEELALGGAQSELAGVFQVSWEESSFFVPMELL